MSNWKALMRTSGLMEGFDPKTAFAMVISPGFWLLRLEKAKALVSPVLNWKWMRPIGNTKTSPLFRTLVKSLFGLDVTNPTKRVPSMTTKSSVLQGWVWGGFRPYGAKSMQAKDMPRVLRHGNLSTFTRLTLDPSLFAAMLLEYWVQVRKNCWLWQLLGPYKIFHSQILHKEKFVIATNKTVL